MKPVPEFVTSDTLRNEIDRLIADLGDARREIIDLRVENRRHLIRARQADTLNDEVELLRQRVEERSIDGMYWVPSLRHEYVHRIQESLYVYGAGVKSALRSLERRGLIRRVPETGGYQVTEDGKLRAQELA